MKTKNLQMPVLRLNNSIALLFTLFLFSSHHSVFSQTQFQAVYSQASENMGTTSVREDSDGYIISTTTGINETTIIKTNSSGVIVWNKTFYGVTNKIIPVTTGGYIMTGTITPTGTQYGFITKINDSGILVWSKVFDTNDVFGINLYDIIETTHNSSQAFAITGVVQRRLISGTGMASDVFSLKITNTGSVIWVRAYGRNTSSVGNNLFERGRSIHEVASGDPAYPNYIITGQCDGYNTSGVDALYVVKVDGTDGSMIFDNIYLPLYPNGNPLHQDYYSDGISQMDASGNIIVLSYGYLVGNITKLSSSGSVTWCKNFSNVNTGAFSGLAVTSGGYAAIASGTSALKTSTAGAVSWGKTYAGDAAGDIIASSDGGYAVASNISVPDESGNSGCLLVKTNSSGESDCYESSLTFSAADNSIQTLTLGGDDPDISSEIYVVDGTGQTAICLNTYSRECSESDEFDYVSGAPVSYTVSEATVATKTLYYINEADETWPVDYTIKWTLIESVGGNTVYTDVTDHSDDDANTYYSTLRTNSGFQHFINPTVRTDKSLCVDVTYAGCMARECFGASPVIGGGNFRESSSDGAVNTIEDISDISAYPNPAKDNVILMIPNGEASVVDIYDLNGRKVKTISVNEVENKLNIGELSSGLYILSVTQSNGATNIKLQVK